MSPRLTDRIVVPRNCSKTVMRRAKEAPECTRWPAAPVLASPPMHTRVEPLPIPARGAAGAGSFPLEPEAVADWLAGLDPLGSAADARELLRGLVHSNRLHNDVERRRRALACFVPPLRALHERLADTARAQPLPLTADFERDRALAADLLREESIAFRALLVDGDAPLEADARRAMQALARIAELDANAYRPIDPGTLADAHALWRWADDVGLGADDAAADDALATLGDHYRTVLALALVDPQRHRARQLPLLIGWLGREAARLGLERVPARAVALVNRRTPGVWLVDLATGAEPVAAGSLLPGERPDVLSIDASELLREAGRRMAVLRAGATSLPGADTLERQTLARLSAALGTPPGRRSARRFDDAPVELVFGVRHICARLFYGDEPDGADAAAEDGPGAAAWRVVDRSSTGLQAVARNPRAGLVQVGELAAVHDGVPGDGAARDGDGPAGASANGAPSSAAPASGGVARHGFLIGTVRRVRAGRDGTLHAGIELLARQAIPVTVSRGDGAEAVPEQALIVACRIGGRTLQTLLVPSFLYQTGDRLRAVSRGRSRDLELARCLQVNGLFSHYAIETPG